MLGEEAAGKQISSHKVSRGASRGRESSRLREGAGVLFCPVFAPS